MNGAQMHVVLQVGVGAFVVNSKREVLVVQERFGPLKGSVKNLFLMAIMDFHIIHASKQIFARLDVRQHLSYFLVGTCDWLVVIIAYRVCII